MDDLKMIMLGMAIIVIINISILSVCPSLGCNDVSTMNIFRGNLLCNACVNISYTIQKYQMQLYVAIGVCFVKKINSVVEQFISS
jgi:hypothetical protein